MYRYEVGKPYNPDRKIWEQSNQFLWRGALEIVSFLDGPTAAEVEAVRSGRSEFALYDRDGLAILCFRFTLPDGSGIPWSDGAYHYALTPEAERVVPPDPRALKPEHRVPLHFTLVNATGGEIRALKVVTLSPELTRALFAAIGRQASRPFDRPTYLQSIRDLYRRHTSDELAAACPIHCLGGA